MSNSPIERAISFVESDSIAITYQSVGQYRSELLRILRETDEPVLSDGHRKLVDLIAECMRDQGNGFDVLASSAWDRVVDHWGKGQD